MTYLRLVHSYRDPVKGYPVQKVIHSFGKVTEVNRKELTSIATSILNYLNESDSDVITSDSTLQWSKSYGTVHLVRELADRLKITSVIRSQLKKRNFDSPVAMAIIAMVVNRLMEPSSMRAMVMSDWLREDIYLPDSEAIRLHHVYRGLDFLEECKEELEEELFWQSRNLFKSKLDMVTVETMLKRLEKFDIDTCLFVCDRGMVSDENLAKLEKAGYGYLVGVIPRGRDKEVRHRVLSVRGRYQKVADNLKVKEVQLEGKRYVICLNDEEAKRDREMREEIIHALPAELEAVNSGKKSSCIISNHATKKRLVRQLNTGKLVPNKGAIGRESRYDGKYVLRTSNMDLDAAELALQYKNLFRVERAFRTLKSGLDLRPLYHRVHHRIKAHVFLCILAYTIARYAEVRTGMTWERITQISRRLQAIKISIKNGDIIRITKVSENLQHIVNKLNIKTPPQIFV